MSAYSLTSTSSLQSLLSTALQHWCSCQEQGNVSSDSAGPVHDKKVQANMVMNSHAKYVDLFPLQMRDADKGKGSKRKQQGEDAEDADDRPSAGRGRGRGRGKRRN